MNKEIISTLKNFDEVWERVSGTPAGREKPVPPTEEGEADDLRRLIRDTAAAAGTYRDLASRTRGVHAKTLLTLAAEKRRSLSRLQMEYFLLTGDTLALPGQRQDREGFLSRLRRCYRNEGLLHRACLAAAQRTENEPLRALHRENAALAAAHQRSLRAMISRAMG
ncbi:MAG: hypothetical protein ACI4PC_04615, partial [Oscillospiraceae bacterium]